MATCSNGNAQRIASAGVMGFVVPAAGPPIGVPLTTLPGPDWQAECGAARSERDRLEAENASLRQQLDSPMRPYVDCICPGCPRRVPQKWASGMCEPCAAEDCEHTDGAREVEAKARELAKALDEATAATITQTQRAFDAEQEVERLRTKGLAIIKDISEQRDRLSAEVAILEGRLRSHEVGLGQVQEERDRLKAENARLTEEHAAIHRDYLAALNERDRYAFRCSGQAETVAAAQAEVEGLRAENAHLDKKAEGWIADCVRTQAERDRLEDEVERLEQRLVTYERAGIDPHKSFCRAPADHMWNCSTATAVAERARAAVTEPTEPERKAKTFDNIRRAWWEFIDVEEGKAALRCLGELIGEWEHHADQREEKRARDHARGYAIAREERDLEAAGVNHDQRDVGAQAQPAGAAAAPTGQAGGAPSGSAGPPGGLGCPKHPEHLCVAMAANMPGRPSGLCVYGCAIDNGHPPPSLKPAYALHVIAGGRELMRVLNGVTPDDLRAQGFPDVAAALERRR